MTSRQIDDVTTAEDYLKACYSNNYYYYPTTSQSSLLPILAGAGGLTLLGILGLGAVKPTTTLVGRSDIGGKKIIQDDNLL